jgi:hypothetical protein
VGVSVSGKAPGVFCWPDACPVSCSAQSSPCFTAQVFAHTHTHTHTLELHPHSYTKTIHLFTEPGPRHARQGQGLEWGGKGGRGPAQRHSHSVFRMSPVLRFSLGEFYCILYGLVRTEVVKTIHISDGPILLLATQHRTNHGWWAEVQTGYCSPFAMLSTLIIC